MYKYMYKSTCKAEFVSFLKNVFGPPTGNQLHDDVDGLPLRTHTDELHNVWVVVLFQDPTDRQTVRGSSKLHTLLPICGQ